MARAPESVFLKLTRAQEHLDAFKGELAAFQNGNPYTVHHQMNHDRREVTYYLVVVREAPARLGLMIGDCVQNLRSALDHLVFNLPRAAGTDPKWERGSQFPICDTPDGFAGIVNRYLLGVDPAAITAVERLQPYDGGNPPEGKPLWYLRELSNLDKHRIIHLIAIIGLGASLEVPNPPTGTVHGILAHDAGMEHGAVIGKMYYSDPAPASVEVKVNLAAGVTIRDIEPAVGVQAALEGAYERVVNAVGTLEHFLP